MSKGNEQRQSSLPPSLHTHLYSGPREHQPLSPTNSTGSQEEPELRASPFDPSRPPAFPLRPLAHAPLAAQLPDPRRSYPLHDAVSQQSPLGLRSSIRLPSPERSGGPSSIPHGSRYRSPVGNEPLYPARPQVSAYPGSHSLPPVFPHSQPIHAPSPWREGEAGPSSMAHPYGGMGRQIIPTYSAPQQIQRRATEPGGYPPDAGFIQHPQYGSYERERFRPQEESFRMQDPRMFQSRGTNISLPPLQPELWPPYGSMRPGEREDLPPLYSAIPSTSTSEYATDESASSRSKGRRADSLEGNPRPTNIPKKINVACDFCRQRKLKCDGLKPTCGNCHARVKECIYVEQPKRRGPGKHTRGGSARGKKRTTPKRQEGESNASTSTLPPGDWDPQTLGMYHPPQPPAPERGRRQPRRGPTPDYRSDEE